MYVKNEEKFLSIFSIWVSNVFREFPDAPEIIWQTEYEKAPNMFHCDTNPSSGYLREMARDKLLKNVTYTKKAKK